MTNKPRYQIVYASPEDRLILSRKLIEKNLSNHGLARLVGVSQPTISRFLMGITGISNDTAGKIYASLGEDSNLDFLLQSPIGIKDPKKVWNDLYQSYVSQLRLVYCDLSVEKKAEIIGNLEALIKQYKPTLQ